MSPAFFVCLSDNPSVRWIRAEFESCKQRLHTRGPWKTRGTEERGLLENRLYFHKKYRIHPIPLWGRR